MADGDDGQRVLVYVDEGEAARLEILELTTGELSTDFGALGGGVAYQWTPERNALVITTSDAPQVHYWRQGEQVRTITLQPTPEDRGEARATFSPDGKILYVLLPSQGLQAYDPATGRLLWQRRAEELTGRDQKPLKSWGTPFTSWLISHNPAQPQLLLASAQGLMLLGTQPQQAPRPLWLDQGFSTTGSNYKIDWSPDGKRAFITAGDFIHEVDAATGKTVGIVDGIKLLAQTPQQLWSRTWDKVVTFERVSGLDTGIRSDAPAWNSSPSLGSSGEPVNVLLKTAEGLSVQNYASGKQIPLSDHFTRSAGFSPDGALIASVGPADVQVMDSGHNVLWRSQTQGSYDLKFSPDGRFLAVGEATQTRIFEAATGKERMALQAPETARDLGARGLNRSLAFSPDGKRLLVGYEAGAAVLWNLTQNGMQQVIKGKRGWILSAAFGPDHQVFALGEGGGQVQTFQAGNPGFSTMLTGAVRSLVFSQDGSMAAGSLNGELRWWNKAGTLVVKQKLPVAITALAFAGTDLLVGDARGQLYRYTPAGKVSSTIKTGSLIQSLDWNARLGKVLVSNRDNTLHSYVLEEQ